MNENEGAMDGLLDGDLMSEDENAMDNLLHESENESANVPKNVKNDCAHHDQKSVSKSDAQSGALNRGCHFCGTNSMNQPECGKTWWITVYFNEEWLGIENNEGKLSIRGEVTH